MKKFRCLTRIGFLVVLLGFFMPISCNQNGFELAEFMIRSGNIGSDANIGGIFLYSLFGSALCGLLLGFIIKNQKICLGVDWLLFSVNITSGLIVFFRMFSKIDLLQIGAYVIVTGWVITFILLLMQNIFLVKRRRSTKQQTS